MSMLKIINYKCDTLNFASSSGQERAVQELSEQGRISFVKYQKSILISPKWFFSHGSSLRLPIRGGGLRVHMAVLFTDEIDNLLFDSYVTKEEHVFSFMMV